MSRGEGSTIVPKPVLHIAVNYKTPARAHGFVNRFCRSRSGSESTSLIIVDNSDGEQRGMLSAELDRRCPGVHCVTAPSNLGYFGGARFGLEVAQRGDSIPEWTIVSNVDLSYGAAALERALARHDPDSIAVVVPRITSSATGLELNPHLRVRPTRLRMHVYKHLFRSYRGLRAYTWLTDRIKNSRAAPRPAGMSCGERVYAAHGCFLILSRGYFARGGSLRHEPFLFGEEISVAEHARRTGLATICDPSIAITHDDHASTGELPGRMLHAYHRHASAWIANEYFRGAPAPRTRDE